MSQSYRRSIPPAALAAIAAVAMAAAPASAVVTTFSNGTEGWSVSGRDNISPVGGNPGATMDVELIDVFGAEIRNDTNPDFLGDYRRFGNGPLKFSVDVNTFSIATVPVGNQVSRDLVLELVDYNPPGSYYPYVSVWVPLGELSAAQSGWRHFESIVQDPNAAALPAGWGGTGDEDPVTYEPILPPDRTFASVLQSIDEIRFTTFVPGYFYTFTNYALAVDNPSVAAVPEPGAGTAIAGTTIALLTARRRRGAPGIAENCD